MATQVVYVFSFLGLILLTFMPCSNSLFFSELLGIKSIATERHNETTKESTSLTTKQNVNVTSDDIDSVGNVNETVILESYSNKTNTSVETIAENLEETGLPISPEEERKAEEKMHLEFIKRQLMAKLRLSSPPIANGQAPVLPLVELGRGYLQTQHDQGKNKYKAHHFYAKTLQLYVMGKDETEHCSYRKSAGCYYFDVNGKVSANDVVDAELWIYKLFYHRDPFIQTFVVSELGRSNRAERKVRPRNIIKRFETKIKHGWLKIDVTETVVRWLQKPRRNDGISILCKGCQRKNHKTIFSSKYDSMPFLAIKTRKGTRERRVRRSAPVQCSIGYDGCCLMPMEINFDVIGWTGIVAPKKLHYAYCRGSCNDEIDAHSEHSRMIQSYRHSDVATPKERREMTPCCSPISFSSQSMLITVNSTVIHHNVPNIIPTACGCL
ncbi:growth/differentiation factor 8-like [Saccostrea echinata]|uniref:growth/differentiation factor 8-like n=1 Tax=Saccostrea echinata TaxID=191078 RepID=UPI002A7FC426|nr:growth/differentiation factor 8-like [Saccostrea echinata]